MKNEVCNHVHQKIPQTQNTYIPTILIFFLATFEVNYKEQKTRYIPTKPSDFKTTNDNFLW